MDILYIKSSTLSPLYIFKTWTVISQKWTVISLCFILFSSQYCHYFLRKKAKLIHYKIADILKNDTTKNLNSFGAHITQE